MPNQSFDFRNNGSMGFAMAHETGRVSLVVGAHEHRTTIYMTPDEAHAMATALEAAASHVENILPTGLGESAVTA